AYTAAPREALTRSQASCPQGAAARLLGRALGGVVRRLDQIAVRLRVEGVDADGLTERLAGPLAIAHGEPGGAGHRPRRRVLGVALAEARDGADRLLRAAAGERGAGVAAGDDRVVGRGLVRAAVLDRGGGGAAAIPQQVAEAQVAARALDPHVAGLVDLAFAVAQAQREDGRRVAARGRPLGERAPPLALERV